MFDAKNLNFSYRLPKSSVAFRNCAGAVDGPESDAGVLAGPPLRRLLQLQGRAAPGLRLPSRHRGRVLAGQARVLITMNHLTTGDLPHHLRLTVHGESRGGDHEAGQAGGQYRGSAGEKGQ